jgi:hypothetical protein
MTVQHWHRGISRLSNWERQVVLEAERSAREMAFGEAYKARCDEHQSLLVDATDLGVRSTEVVWGRGDGNLYLRITVHFVGRGRLRIYQWRKRVPDAHRKRKHS